MAQMGCEFLLKMTAIPSITGHVGMLSRRSWKPPFKPVKQYDTPKNQPHCTVKNTRAPPLEASEQTTMFDDFSIQRGFDFAGAVTDA